MEEQKDGHSRQPTVSTRIQETDVPVMTMTRRMLAGTSGALSLAQGAVYWGPPEDVVREVAARATEPVFSEYGNDEGIPELRSALLDKLREQNKLDGYNVMVTAGANQAVATLMITLLDPGDRLVLFKPYYFNALMAAQLAGCARSVSFGPSDLSTFTPDLDWLEAELQGPNPPRLVFIVNPCNPTGVTMSPDQVRRAAAMTEAAGCWLVLDNTYEAYLYSGQTHLAPSGSHIIHIFSFSKSHGLMGWRVGYIAYPDFDGKDSLGLQLVKVQDTVPIHSAIMSQNIALGSLLKGKPYLDQRLKSLEANRSAALDALSPIGKLNNGVWGGDAIYLWAKLPEGCEDDRSVVKWLLYKHGVMVIPGSACGTPGYIRVAFGKPSPDAFGPAAERLKAALTELVAVGPLAVKQWLMSNGKSDVHGAQ